MCCNHGDGGYNVTVRDNLQVKVVANSSNLRQLCSMLVQLVPNQIGVGGSALANSLAKHPHIHCTTVLERTDSNAMEVLKTMDSSQFNCKLLDT